MKKIGLALAFVVALLGVQSQVHADVADYEVHALIPATQIKGNHTEAFDMVLAPNQTQNMSFVITNHTDKDIVFDIAKGTAKTTVNGNVNYTADDTTFDTSMPEPIGEDMQIPATVTAKAATNTGFNVTLKTPKTAWRVLLAGGIKITPRGEVATKKTESSDDQGITTIPKTIGVFVRNKDGLPVAKPAFDSAAIKRIKGKPALGILVRNPNGNFVNKFRVTAQVVDKHGKIVLQREQAGMTMAPYSKMTWPINLKKTGLPSGDYTVRLAARWVRDSVTGDYVDNISDKKEFVKHWETKVNVTADEFTTRHVNTWSWLDTMMVLILFVLVVAIVTVIIKIRGLHKRY